MNEGRVAQISFKDDTGKMKTMDFPQTNKIGENSYHTNSLSLDQIKEIYHDEQQERTANQVKQAAILNHISAQK